MDMNKPIPKGRNLPPLELLPEREWLNAKITEVVYQQAVFMGKPAFLTDKDKNLVLDNDDKPIPNMEFKITFALSNHSLHNGDPRRAWLNMGASLGKKAKLVKFCANMKINTDGEFTPQTFIEATKGKEVKLQMANVEKEGKTYQNVVFDAVKPA